MPVAPVPVKLVGSSVFGRYPYVNAERTYNMYMSDGSLITFGGYKPASILSESNSSQGRGIYHSTRGGFMIVVISSVVYRINKISQTPIFLFEIGSSTGDIFIDENLSSQIALVGGSECWIYNYDTNTFGQPMLDANLVPNYVTYQNTHFIFGNANITSFGSQWFVYRADTGFNLQYVTQLALQTKPDFAIAAIRIPGLGNNILVFGKFVAEIWTDIGGLQVYQRNSSLNIDYGCISVSTIAANEEMVCWLAANEASAPVIMTMRGGRAERISTDGIDFLMDSLVHPEQSTAFFYRQDGHLFYILTFYSTADNLTIAYDFNAKAFYDITDWNFNYFPARQVAYFNQQTYFVNINDGVVYEIGSDLTTYLTAAQEYEIPRIRVCDTFRSPNSDPFVIDEFSMTMENGTEPDLHFTVEQPRIDVSLSKDGGNTFGNAVPYYMHDTGYYQSRPRFYGLGRANSITIQLRFWGFWRFIMKDGQLKVRT